MKPETEIETPRLVIRSWRKTDRDATVAMWCDPENGKYMTEPVLENVDEKPPKPPKGQIPIDVKPNHLYPQKMPLRPPVPPKPPRQRRTVCRRAGTQNSRRRKSLPKLPEYSRAQSSP